MDERFHLGEILVESRSYTLVEVSAICGVQVALLCELVAFGILDPTGATHDAWQFSESGLQRAKLALRLHRDLGLADQGLALSLELLDEIKRLRRKLERLGG